MCIVYAQGCFGQLLLKSDVSHAQGVRGEREAESSVHMYMYMSGYVCMYSDG